LSAANAIVARLFPSAAKKGGGRTTVPRRQKRDRLGARKAADRSLPKLAAMRKRSGDIIYFAKHAAKRRFLRLK
jgi:hypothetical protein